MPTETLPSEVILLTPFRTQGCFNVYFNRRSEVWGLMRDWSRNGSVEIPDDPELEVDLTGPEYGFSRKNQIQLERKEDMKRR